MSATPAVWSWDPATWLALMQHFLTLSLMSIGGAITLVPDMHRRLVVEDHLLSNADFTSAIALAQAAPGPNVLFVALMGWYSAGLPGSLASMLGIMLPSTTFTMVVSRWVAQHKEALAVRAFQTGMTPVTVGLLLATGWLITPDAGHPRALALSGVVAVLVWRTQIRLIWLVGAGALLGALGWV